jgi:Tfp pilus assembly pilus retraction ATPase PilT
MAFSIGLSDFFALSALILSAYSIKKTVDFNKRQKEFIETNDKLNKMLLEKESQDALQQKKADISANFIDIGKNNYRLKVFNKGKSTANNIRIDFPEGNELFIDSDVKRKFPVPILEQHQYVELLTASSLGSPNRITIKLLWDDEYKKDNEKILTPTK